jgi:copper chaperone NosL
MSIFQKFIGPRAPTDLDETDRRVYRIPTILFVVAAVLLLISIFLPYWEMTLLAPQYPKGLHVTAYVNELTGDVAEIDGLNHYIGMRPLAEAATFERSVSIFAIAAIAFLILAAVFVHTKWVVLFVLPAIFMPVVFLADLQFWLAEFGTNLDETAALSSAIEPFIPKVLGRGIIAQFETVAAPGLGLWLAIFASILCIVGLYYHRKAYKPLVEATDMSVEPAAE